MANVTQCDVCGNVVKHEQSKYLQLFRVTSEDKKGAEIANADLCPECTAKVLKVLGMEVPR